MRGVFVTGSGTDVGKTYIMQTLIAELGAAGRRLRVIKPVASGFDATRPECSDPGLLLAAQTLPLSARNLDRLSPWRFAAALSPDMAAERERRRIPFEELLAFCRADEPGTLTLIEGIGGVMVPLDEQHTVLDWIAALSTPVLLVTGSYLGSLSHTLTAAEALQGRAVRIAAVLVSESADTSVGLKETTKVLERFLAPVPVSAVPRGGRPRLQPLLAPYVDLGP